MRFLFLFFIVIPLVEMLVLFEVAEAVGGLTTLGLVVLTAFVGVQVLRLQGLSTLTRAHQRLESGELPAQEIVEGMLLAAAGALLLTPGFITDTLGFAFLTGPIRRPLARRIISAGLLTASGAGGRSGFTFYSSHSTRGYTPGAAPGQGGKGSTYEGEYSRDDAQRIQRDPREH